jgi:hypothetical protein
MEEFAERRRAHSVDYAGIEVKKCRAWYVLAARGLVVKQIDAVELRVVVAAELAVAADAVLVAKHLLKIGAHLVTALARLRVNNPARRSSLEAGSTQDKNGGEERRSVSPCRSLARETGNAGGVSAHAGCGRVQSRNICFGHVLVGVRQDQRRDAAATGEERNGRSAAGKSKYIRLYR